MSDPTPTAPAAATPFLQTPSRKVIAGLLSDLAMSAIAWAAQKHGLSLDPQIGASLAVLVSAGVGFGVAYVVPNQ